jgi:hypothetical protein
MFLDLTPLVCDYNVHERTTLRRIAAQITLNLTLADAIELARSVFTPRREKPRSQASK